MVNLDDVCRDFSQFIFGERFLDVGIDGFIPVGLHGELLQVDDGHAQFVSEAIKHANENNADDKCKPNVMWVGAE